MKHLLALVAVVVLGVISSSCTIPQLERTGARLAEGQNKLEQGLQLVQTGLGAVQGTVANLKQADTNQDGKVSVSEMISYLALVLGGGGALLSSKGDKKIQVQVDELYDKTHKPA